MLTEKGTGFFIQNTSFLFITGFTLRSQALARRIEAPVTDCYIALTLGLTMLKSHSFCFNTTAKIEVLCRIFFKVSLKVIFAYMF